MARTLEEIKGALTAIQIAKQSKDVQIWLKEIKTIADDMVVQSLNLTGEESVRAWGVQKGLGIAMMIEEILLATVQGKEASEMAAVRTKLKL